MDVCRAVDAPWVAVPKVRTNIYIYILLKKIYIFSNVNYNNDTGINVDCDNAITNTITNDDIGTTAGTETGTSTSTGLLTQ